MPTAPIHIAQFGMGPIGIETVRHAAGKPWAKVVGAVDIDPHKVGKTLAELTGVESLSDAKVHASFDELWQRTAEPANVVIHTAGSNAAEAIEQITPMVAAGVSVVSSCEELLFPKLRAAEPAAALDALCRKNNARVVGTGVNPGFVMDLLPLVLTGVCRNVEKIYAQRIVNASRRRQPLQKKIGSGLEPDEFRDRFKQGKVGHAGFEESVALLARTLGWELDEVTQTCEPMVAPSQIVTDFFRVPMGMTRGLHQRCVGTVDGQIKIELDLQMYLNAPDERDAIRIDGDPPIDLVIRNGIWGDGATVAALINAVPPLLAAPPGLRLVTELPPPCCM